MAGHGAGFRPTPDRPRSASENQRVTRTRCPFGFPPGGCRAGPVPRPGCGVTWDRTSTHRRAAVASESEEQTRCSVAGTAVVRRRPSVLVMKLPLKAAGATLDLGLARSRTQREAAAGWLRGL